MKKIILSFLITTVTLSVFAQKKTTTSAIITFDATTVLDALPKAENKTVVAALDTKSGTAAKVRVLIESQDETDSWTTVGVHENIIEASWEALIDSIEYKLLKDQSKKPKTK